MDRDLFAARLAEALALRRAVLPPDTTGWRVLNAEGDGVPGWTVDRFGDTFVSQITVAGLEALRGEAYAALGRRSPAPTSCSPTPPPPAAARGCRPRTRSSPATRRRTPCSPSPA